MPIRILPPDLASQIAAGEVVERPASVVRELVDNALDAGARRVRVDVERGGTRSITVIDDGCGMTPEDALLSVERHSTSKISSLDDLQNIATLGFRGEALASIASVSRLTLETRTADAAAGTRVSVEGGLDRRDEEVGTPVGTTVRVQDLFFNVPARRKFLRTEATELRHVTEAVTRAALAWDGVHFQLAHNRRDVFDLPRAASRFERVAAVLGRSHAAWLLPVAAESGGMSIEGFVSPPSEHRKSADQVYFLLNGRYISNRMLLSALLRGYERAMAPRRYPVAVLYLQVDPREVDVNVHPTKLEVKFSNDGRVFSLVSGSIRRMLEDGTGLFGGQAETTGEERSAGDSTAVVAPPTGEEPPRTPAEPSDVSGKPHAPAAEPRGGPAPAPQDEEERRRERIRSKIEEFSRRDVDVPRAGRSRGAAGPARAFERPREPEPPQSEPEIVSHRRTMRAVAQVLDTYILCDDGETLTVLDMHAAHERLRYEELKRAAAGKSAASQALLFPQRVEFSVSEAQSVGEHLNALRRLGFEMEAFGGGSFLVTETPAILRPGQVEPILRDLAEELREHGSADSLEALTDRLLITMACHHVLRSGDRVEAGEMQALVDRLLECPNADTCPHGRPTWVRFSRGDLERLFKRTGF